MKRLLFVIPVLLAILATTYQNAQTHITTAQETPTLYFSGEDAIGYVEMQLSFGLRPVGSPALEQTRQAMIAELEAEGWEIVIQSFEHNAEGTSYEVKNVIAKKGTGKITIIGSHYDSRLLADNDPDANKHTEGVMGANDGASSTATVLELANVIDDNYTLAADKQIWLVFFDAEDNGHIPGWDWIQGSRYMAEHLDELGVTATDIEFMILLDMIGEAEGQEFRLEANSLNSAPAESVALWQYAGMLGYADHFAPIERGPIIDDHLPFIEQNIKAVDIIDLNYPYWHTTQDTIDKISADSLERVGRVVELFLIKSGRMTPKS
jgi:glutaminyl-peptide cyclotransferase